MLRALHNKHFTLWLHISFLRHFFLGLLIALVILSQVFLHHCHLFVWQGTKYDNHALVEGKYTTIHRWHAKKLIEEKQAEAGGGGLLGDNLGLNYQDQQKIINLPPI